jgi:hypothetical protein
MKEMVHETRAKGVRSMNGRNFFFIRYQDNYAKAIVTVIEESLREEKET